MNLTGVELAGIVTASTGAFAAIGKAARWFFSSRVSREKWVDQRVRDVFDDIQIAAERADERSAKLMVRVTELEKRIARQDSVLQMVLPELARLDPVSPILRHAHNVLNIAFPVPNTPAPDTIKDLLDDPRINR